MSYTNISKLIYVLPTPKNTPTKIKQKPVHHCINKNSLQILKTNICEDKNTIPIKKINSSFVDKTIPHEQFLEKQKKYRTIKDMLDKINGKVQKEEPIMENKSFKKVSKFQNEKFFESKKDNSIATYTDKNLLNAECNFKKSSLNSRNNETNIINKNSTYNKPKGTSKFSINEGNTQILPKNGTNTNKSVRSSLTFNGEKENKKKIEQNMNLEKEKRKKEVIKERLQELHKNTLKILELNIKKTRKLNTQPKISGKLASSVKLNRRDPNIVKSSKNENLYNTQKLCFKNEKIEVNKRIGLLRKANSDEHSFSNVINYDINKGNEMLESLVKSKNCFASTSNVSTNNNTALLKHSVCVIDKDKDVNNCLQTRIENQCNIDANLIQENGNNVISFGKEIDNHISFQIPKFRLEAKTFHNKSEKSIQTQVSMDNQKENIPTTEIAEAKDIANWLKSSPVQIYPYNFITAVRKKLEALTNPVVPRSKINQRNRKSNNKILLVDYQETPLSYLKTPNENVRRRIIDNNHSIISSSNPTYSQSAEKSSSVSEMVSNFSSVSLHVPETNSITNISSVKSTKIHSKKIDCGNDDTTISSSIFSSPEKKINFDKIKQNTEDKMSENISKSLSPLSLENTYNLQIRSKNQNNKMNKDDTLFIPKLNLTLRTRNTEQEDKDSNQHEQSISQLDQLLVGFNKSLSKVIEVNNQLKHTLDKSKKIFSPNSKENMVNKNYYTPIVIRPSTSSFATCGEYISDFEDDESNSTLTSFQLDSTKKPSLKHNFTFENVVSSKPISIIENKTSVSNIYQNTQKSTKEITRSIMKEDTKNVIESPQSKGSNIEFLNLEDLQNNLDEKLTFINSHVNNTRGNDVVILDEQSNTATENSSVCFSPIYSDRKQKKKKYSHVGNELIAVYNKSDVEISMFLQDENQSITNEATLNYSSIGMYEQLLQSENLKSEQLTALLRIREKVLIDRTKGQIAWLEIQKEKYKSKGLFEQITAIKKKQRAILVKMEKEREEIKKLINNQSSISGKRPERITNQHQSTLLKTYRPKLSDSISNITIRKGFATTTINKTKSSTKIIRGFEINASRDLEKILQKREEELKQRREHVEDLMAWHYRLDKEEQEVFQLEKMLLEYNKASSSHITSIKRFILSENEKKKKINDIEKSLRELQSISVSSKENTINIDYVRISGHKLNKLWARLTGQKINKFDSHKKYKLTKEDLEKFYERAKKKVTEEFYKECNLSKLLGKSSNENISAFGNSSSEENIGTILVHSVDVPSLHLNFSSESEMCHTIDSNFVRLTKNEITDMHNNNFEENSFLPKKIEPANISNTKISDVLFKEKNEGKQVTIKKDMQENKAFENFSRFTKNEFENFEDILINANKTCATKKITTDHDNLDKTEIFEHLSESHCNTTKQETFVLKDCSSETRNSSEGSVSQIVEYSQISEDVCESNNFLAEILNSEQSCASVITSSFSNIANGSVNSFKTKNILLGNNPGITSGKNEKNTSTVVSTTLSPKASTYIKPSSAQSTEIIDIATKTLFSMSSEKTQNNESNSINNLSKTIPISVENKTVSKILTTEKNQTIFDIPKPEKNSECSYEYENDFSGSDLTNLEDISMPKFETTMETTKLRLSDDINSIESSETITSKKTVDFNQNISNATELEKRLIDLDGSLKHLNYTIEKVLHSEKKPTETNSSTVSNIFPTSISSVAITKAPATISPALTQSVLSSAAIQQTTNSISSTIISNNVNEYDKITLMPDIISEVEICRRQQILFESEIKQLEHAMPYVIFREIPNKPPPPYVPPAHGSPMTTIFPSESRIKELTFFKTAELFEELSKKNEKLPKSNNSILNEQITNIYERIIIDICKECMQEYEETLQDLNPESYKNPLSFFNPPDRLNCMQRFIYCRVRKLLATEKNLYRKNSIFLIGRKKRDYVDDILIQELFEEDYKWTNFDQEEDEVKILIIEEILNSVIKEVVIESVSRNKDTHIENRISTLNEVVIEKHDLQEE